MSGMTRNYQAEQKELRYQTERRKEGHNMKREDVTKIFEGATDEQINALLDVNSADIGKAKADYNEKLEEIKALNKTVSDRDNQLKTLKRSLETAEYAVADREQHSKRKLSKRTGQT